MGDDEVIRCEALHAINYRIDNTQRTVRRGLQDQVYGQIAGYS